VAGYRSKPSARGCGARHSPQSGRHALRHVAASGGALQIFALSASTQFAPRDLFVATHVSSVLGESRTEHGESSYDVGLVAEFNNHFYDIFWSADWTAPPPKGRRFGLAEPAR
jgi:hypothetical protein